MSDRVIERERGWRDEVVRDSGTKQNAILTRNYLDRNTRARNKPSDVFVIAKKLFVSVKLQKILYIAKSPLNIT